MGISKVDLNGNAGQEKSFSQIAKYPYEQLIKPVDELPEGVDPTQREVGKKKLWLFHKKGMEQLRYRI